MDNFPDQKNNESPNNEIKDKMNSIGEGYRFDSETNMVIPDIEDATVPPEVAKNLEATQENSAENAVEEGEAEKTLNPRVESLAIPLARDYAEKNYAKRDDGTFEPAWRGVNGESDYKNKSPEDLMAEGMPEAEARAAVIDIANQPYNEYSEYWKDQNRGGAEFLIDLIDKKGESTIAGLNLGDEATRAEYGDLIHNNWLERNEWVKDPEYGDPKLAVSFAELSPEEQQKDIDQLEVTQKWLAENTPHPEPEPGPNPWGYNGDTHAGDGFSDQTYMSGGATMTEYEADHANDGNKGGQTGTDTGAVDRSGNTAQVEAHKNLRPHSAQEEEERIKRGDF